MKNQQKYLCEVMLLNAMRSCSKEGIQIDPVDKNTYVPSDVFLIEHKLDELKAKIKLEDNEKKIITNHFQEVSRLILEITSDIQKGQWTNGLLKRFRRELDFIYSQFSSVPDAIEINSDDQLRNVNSYEYLHELLKKVPVRERTKSGIFAEIYQHCNKNAGYKPLTPYGDIYTRFLSLFQEYIATLLNQKADATDELSISRIDQELKRYDDLIDAIFKSPNFSLERSFYVIEEAIHKVNQTDPGALEKAIKKRFAAVKAEATNVMTPSEAGSLFGRMKASFSSNYKPMTTTNQPSIVNLSYKKPEDPVQLRFSTQGEIHDSVARINPLFTRWVQIQSEKPTTNAIVHVYFNNLTRSEESEKIIDLEGKSRERELTAVLEKMENSNNKIAVITLPADGGLMDRHLKKAGDTIASETAISEIISIAQGESKDKFADDFHISEPVKRLLYGEGVAADEFDKEQQPCDKLNEKIKLRELLEATFIKLGFAKRTQAGGVEYQPVLNRVDYQAVYFHFIKFEMPNFILKTLQPASFNFSCKDAIDRGGVSSAYYNLVKSIESGNPISQEEFERTLHAAPALVKGRGMNSHSQLIWNAVDAYVEANKNNNSMPAWLPKWRDANMVSQSLERKLDIRFGEYINLLKDYIKNREKGGEGGLVAGMFPALKKDNKLTAAGLLLGQLHEARQSNQLGDQLRYGLNIDLTVTDSNIKTALDHGTLRGIVDELKASGFKINIKVIAPENEIKKNEV